MDPLRIAVRILAAYLYLLFSARVSGKRVISQSDAFDFVVALIIGDVIDDAIWAEVSFSEFAAALTSICLADAITKLVATHFHPVYRVVAGRPRVVLHNGVENQSEMRHEQMNESELAGLLRLEGINRRQEVRFGLVEIDGHLSVLKRDWAEPVQKKDQKRVEEFL